LKFNYSLGRKRRHQTAVADAVSRGLMSCRSPDSSQQLT
jgi:hypothetical protein